MILAAALVLSGLPAPVAEALADRPQDGALVYRITHLTNGTEITSEYDTRAPVGERVTVISPSQEELPEGIEAAIRNYETQIDGNVWCDSMDDVLDESLTLVEEAPGTQTYRFKPVPEEDGDKMARRFAESAIGRLILVERDDAWHVQSMTMSLEKPFKPAMIAKIDKLDISVSCAAGPDGRAYRAETTTTVAGSAMGNDFEEFERVRISDIRLLQD